MATHESSPARSPFYAIFPNHSSLIAGVIFLAGLGLSIFLAFQSFNITAPLPAEADPTIFSAERAMQHLPAIAAMPRPVGSQGHEDTRAYLIGELTAMGLEPQVQDTHTLLRFEGAPGFSAGSVRNVVVKIPGTEGKQAIALDAHYDGAATGPAAADCGSGLITLLETIRAVLEGPPLKNDLIFVFADAEELGDLGAHAFVSRHPWMDNIRLALNYEAMGTSGPVYLYATNKGNHSLIRSFAGAHTSALTNSFTVGIFNLFPGQRLACDLQDYMDQGSAGLGFVFTGDISFYHTQLDNIANLDPGTIQELGMTTLQLLRKLGNEDLTGLAGEEEAVFFSLLPGGMIHYPASWSLPLSLFALIILVFQLVVGTRQRKWTFLEILGTTLLQIAGILFALFLTLMLWSGLKMLNPHLDAFLIGNWGIRWFWAGLLLMALVFSIQWLLWLHRRRSWLSIWMSSLMSYAFLAILMSWVYPVGSYLFLWPVLLGTLIMGWRLLYQPKELPSWKYSLAALVVIIPSVLFFVPMIAGANPFTGLLIRLDAMTGMPVLALGVFFIILWSILCIPLIMDVFSGKNRHRVLVRLSWLMALASIVCLGIAWSQSGFNKNKPHPESIRYEFNFNEHKAQWVSGDHRIGAWTGRFLKQDSTVVEKEPSSVLFDWPATFSAPAPVVDLHPPEAVVLQTDTLGNTRIVKLRLLSARRAGMMRVQITASGPLQKASLNGQAFDLADYLPAREGQLLFNYAALPEEGIELQLSIEGLAPLQCTLIDMKDGLPSPLVDSAVRPAGTMPSPLSADCTVVSKTIHF